MVDMDVDGRRRVVLVTSLCLPAIVAAEVLARGPHVLCAGEGTVLEEANESGFAVAVCRACTSHGQKGEDEKGEKHS